MIRCNNCGGSGKWLDIGCIYKKCDECAGTGWLLEDGEESTPKADLKPTGKEIQVTMDSAKEEAKAAQKKLQSERMKAMWAKKKAAKNDKQ